MEKEDLRRYTQEKMSIQIIKEDIEQLESLMTNIAAKPISDEPRSGAAAPDDRLVNILQQLEDKRDKYIKALDNLIMWHGTIERHIDKVKDTRYRNILKSKYILGKTFETIANETGYDIRHCQRLHGEALEEIRKIKIKGEDIYVD